MLITHLKWLLRLQKIKPLAKKALTSGIVPTGKKIGEKSGDLIMKKSMKKTSTSTPKKVTFKEPGKKESKGILINRLISGSGEKKFKKLYNL